MIELFLGLLICSNAYFEGARSEVAPPQSSIDFSNAKDNVLELSTCSDIPVKACWKSLIEAGAKPNVSRWPNELFQDSSWRGAGLTFQCDMFDSQACYLIGWGRCAFSFCDFSISLNSHFEMESRQTLTIERQGANALCRPLALWFYINFREIVTYYCRFRLEFNSMLRLLHQYGVLDRPRPSLRSG